MAQLGGYYQTIFSQQPNALATREECEEMLASADAHFKPFAVTEDMLRLWPNRISDDPHTSMLFLERPFQVGPDRVLSLPAYAALLGFRPPHRPVCFPFTGKHLLEAAAYLSELLIQGRPLPRPEHLDDPQDEQYVGPWEFWRRLHGGRYAKEQDLALAFLAAVDLTLVTDVIEPQILDDEQQYEVYSIPYRFGKLAFRAQGIPPLRAGKRNVAAAVVRFQEELCRYSSWLPPTTVARKMAVFLTRCLLKAFAQMGGVGLDAPTVQAISWVLRAPIAEAAEHFDIVERTWRGFPRVGLTTNRLLGQHTVGMMLNACVDRIRHPGELAVPHTYAASLIDRFPFPFIMADGHYYYDVAGGLPDERRDDQPFPLAPEDLWADCVGLMAISPLQRGMNRCGFLEEAVQCAYVQFGLGCPHQALTEAQRQLRLQTGLDDWCHWTCKSLVLHTAAPDVLQRWRERWQVPLPTLYRGPTGPGDQPAGSSAQAVPDD